AALRGKLPAAPRSGVGRSGKSGADRARQVVDGASRSIIGQLSRGRKGRPLCPSVAGSRISAETKTLFTGCVVPAPPSAMIWPECVGPAPLLVAPAEPAS